MGSSNCPYKKITKYHLFNFDWILMRRMQLAFRWEHDRNSWDFLLTDIFDISIYKGSNLWHVGDPLYTSDFMLSSDSVGKRRYYNHRNLLKKIWPRWTVMTNFYPLKIWLFSSERKKQKTQMSSFLMTSYQREPAHSTHVFSRYRVFEIPLFFSTLHYSRADSAVFHHLAHKLLLYSRNVISHRHGE